ncbi:coatomer subunit beta'-2 isoform X2 [Triticum aestivum]|uniref:coatomer subunit beta'-2 isoform X2 n=1 Tax=Triticum aestivum TaxID=4565 RepID=UPI001D02A4CA|nr:coatomer subunit beta'-2-like isoform X2 [Triticum aestivum]
MEHSGLESMHAGREKATNLPCASLENIMEDSSYERINSQGVSRRVYKVITGSCEALDVHPLELRFPLDYNALIPFPCPLHLTNNTDEQVAFKLKPKRGIYSCFRNIPLYGVVPQRSTYTLIVIMTPPAKLSEDTDFDLILQSIKFGEGIIQGQCNDRFFEAAKEVGTVMHEVTLKAVSAPQGETIYKHTIPPVMKVISVERARQELYSIDANPEKSWIIIGHSGGYVRIWDYVTQRWRGPIQISRGPLDCIKFIARKQWFVAGSSDGIHVQEEAIKKKKIQRFRARVSSVTSLAVHPTKPYVLSSSYGGLIKLWDWDKGWECITTFEGEHSDVVCQLAFNPNDTSSFASVSNDRTIKVWGLDSPKSHYTLSGHSDNVKCLDFFTRDDGQYLITGSVDNTAKIWDLQKKTCILTLEVFRSPVIYVFSHPNLPVLITGTRNGIIYLWSSTDFSAITRNTN